MIIKKILLENFKSYNKEEISFEKGLNIISGTIGTGKTSLFEAFQWFVEEEMGQLIEEKHVIHSNAIAETKEEKELKVSVSLVCSIKNHETTTTKTHIYKKIKDKLELKEESYIHKYTDSISGSSMIEENGAEVRRIIAKNIFPSQIRRYILFKGEQLESLIDFKKPETLRNAVDRISFLKYYEKIYKDTEQILKKLIVKRDTLLRTENKNKKKRDQLQGEIDKLEKFKIPELEKDLKKLDDEVENLKTKKGELLASIKATGSFFEIKKKLDDSKRDLETQKKIKVAHNGRFHKIFLSRLMLHGLDEPLKKFDQLFVEHNKKWSALLNTLNNQLRVGEPGDARIDEMLENCKCVFCGTEFKKGDEKYQKIKSHKDKNKVKTTNSITEEESQLNNSIVEIGGAVPSIKIISSQARSEWEKHLEDMNKTEDETNRLADEVTKYQAQISNLISTNPSLSSGSINPENEFSYVDGELQQKSRIFESKTKQLYEYQAELTKKTNEKLGLASNLTQIKNSKEQKAIDHVMVIKNLSEKKIEEETKKFITQIQDSTNKIQEEIIKEGNKNIAVMKTKIDPVSMAIEHFDSKGAPNPGHGAQHTLAKLAIISSVLKLSSGVQEPFPLILDAPASNFDHTIIGPFMQSISKNLTQSIVLLKDIDKEIEYFKKQEYVDQIHILNTELYDKSLPADDLSNKYTKIDKLK